MPLEVQAKPLRVLESGEVKPVGATRPFHADARVVAATLRNLQHWARQGKFREDLYYLLCGMPLVLPPLRNLTGDIRLLAEHFVHLHAPRGQMPKVTSAALARLHQHSWPGNIRELLHVVRRALFIRKGPKLDAADILFEEAYSHASEDTALPELARIGHTEHARGEGTAA